MCRVIRVHWSEVMERNLVFLVRNCAWHLKLLDKMHFHRYYRISVNTCFESEWKQHFREIFSISSYFFKQVSVLLKQGFYCSWTLSTRFPRWRRAILSCGIATPSTFTSSANMEQKNHSTPKTCRRELLLTRDSTLITVFCFPHSSPLQ